MNEFDPVKFSLEENQFLYDHLGEPAIVAERGLRPSMVAKAVMPVIERVYQLDQLTKHSGEEWAGVDAVKGAIKTYLTQYEKWKNDRRRGAPRFPSMYSYDSKGRPHRGGIGADAGQVRTYFDEKGNRVPFAIQLIPDNVQDWTAPWSEVKEISKGLKVNGEANRIECEVCGHTESFNPDSRGSYNVARARISKHLRTSTKEPDAHREIHTNEFGG